jgi:hypothetical protein
MLQPSQGQAARKIQEAAAAQDMQEQLVGPVIFNVFLIGLEIYCNILHHPDFLSVSCLCASLNETNRKGSVIISCHQVIEVLHSLLSQKSQAIILSYLANYKKCK